MKKIFTILVMVSVLLFINSCGSKKNKKDIARMAKEKVKEVVRATVTDKDKEANHQEETKEEKDKVSENPIAAMQQFAEKVKKASEQQQGGKIEVMNEEDFLKILPDISGWKLKEKPYYSKDSVSSMVTSKIRATYTNGKKDVLVNIQDTGSMSSLIAPMKMALSMMISHEDSNGYEKPFDFKGEKGIEKYNKNSERGKITLLVKSRYIIEIRSYQGVAMSELKQFLDKINIGEFK